MNGQRFLIYCPVGAKTGGPECLYQLGSMLKELGYNAVIIPTIETTGEKPVPEFLEYGLEHVSLRKIQKNDVLVVPEITRIPKYFIRKIQRPIVMWWLSVDNSSHSFFKNYEKRNHTYNKNWISRDSDVTKAKAINRLLILLSGRSQNTVLNSFRSRLKPLLVKFRTRELELEKCFHIAQSYYAKTLVSSYFNLPVQLVSDYINVGKNFPPKRFEAKFEHDDKYLIAVNPAKGKEFTDQLMEIMDEKYKFIPIINMNNDEVRSTLSRSHLYLDLGHFPGRDKIPRESILCGTPVVLALRGAARNSRDFRINEKYKINLSHNGPYEVKNKINFILKNEKNIDQWEFLQEQISGYEKFKEEVNRFILSYNEKLS
jgi:hypothetical protein